MSEAQRNQAPTQTPEALVPEDVRFIQDLSETLASVGQSGKESSVVATSVERVLGTGTDYITAVEGSSRDAEPVKLLYLAETMGASSLDARTHAKDALGEISSLSDKQMSRLAEMSDILYKYRIRELEPSMLAAEITAHVDVAVADSQNNPDTTGDSQQYELALLAFGVGATIGDKEYSASARQRLAQALPNSTPPKAIDRGSRA